MALLFGVPLFINCGFPHCLADAFYYLTVPVSYTMAHLAEVLIAHNIITQLEKLVVKNNFRYSYIVTGKNNHAAIKLYEKLNYKLIDNFGQFIDDDTVICMKKDFK